MKACSTCKVTKPFTEFHANRSKKDGLQAQCKVCMRKAVDAWQKKNLKKVRATTAAWAKRSVIKPDSAVALNGGTLTEAEARYLRYRTRKKVRKHGITEDAYRSLLDRAAGVCMICGDPPEDDFHLDHDHETGKVRGLLCHLCNKGLGQFKDDPERLIKAAEYLRRHA